MKKVLLILQFFIIALANAQYNDSAKLYKTYEYNFAVPAQYLITDILVEVSNNKPIQKSLVVLYSGLSKNQYLKIPGTDISKAIENLWSQHTYSDVQIYLKETRPGEAIINIVVSEQTRIARYGFWGIRNSEKKDLKEKVSLKRGKYITPNLLNVTRYKILNHYKDKGYYYVDVNIKRVPDTATGYEILDIEIDKGNKVKLYDIEIEGNEFLSDAQIRKSIKKIKRKKNKYLPLKSSKYTAKAWKEERRNVIAKYLIEGYRDAKILKDTLIMGPGEKRVTKKLTVTEGNKYYFGNISWKGNKKLSTGTLDTLLGITNGYVFNQQLLEERLYANPGGFDIQSIYMDDGYLFFNMQWVETGIKNDSIDIEIRINEGEQARIGRVNWVGNTKTHDRVILREIRTKPGDIFNRSEIQRTMRDLGALGLFDPAAMNVNPKPNPANGTVDIDYILAEKPSDQIELSGGWGGNGLNNRPSVIGTAGVVLNNFSTRNMFRRKSWSPVPTGDGQKLTLRAQSNGSNYQGYTFSFTEPWFGGKKPNSLSVSIFHTVNSFDFRTRQDPNRQVFFNTGMNLALGKRLKIPDDFFNIQYTLSLQQYNVQNLDGGFYGFPTGFTGKSYNFSLQTTLARSSVSDMIYPSSGSSFSLSLQATPPFSLLSSRNIATLPQTEKYKLAEFYKWKLDADWYTTIWKKMVLATRARFGFLGHYNSELGTTFFERFQVGGAGMFGFNIAATEIISQRGYDNYTISQKAMGSQSGAPLFNKFTTELRYSVVQSPTATVYGLAFLEAGNAWRNIKDYNPFQLKRAAGVGVRLFMPMFGLIGLDYGYGFDYRSIDPLSKPGQIHFFIGQQF